MPILTHVHSYVRYKNNQWKRKDLFKCNDPGCTSVSEKALIVGKYSLCPICGQKFILTREDLKRAIPKCMDCSNTKVSRDRKKVNELVSSLLSPAAVVPIKGDFEI